MSTYEDEHSVDNHTEPRERRHVTLGNAVEDLLSSRRGDIQSQTQTEAVMQVLRQFESETHEAGLNALITQLGDSAPYDQGVSGSFIDSLDRVSKSALTKQNKACPICTNDFLDDPYPLVVKLPCNASHWFDLECIGPWLKVRDSCPLCRIKVSTIGKERREEILKQTQQTQDEDEEEDDYMYG